MLPGHSTKTNVGLGVGLVGFDILYFAPFGPLPVQLLWGICGVSLLFYSWGCYNYITGKGHAGWLMIIGWIPFGVFILAMFPDRRQTTRRPPYRRPGFIRKDRRIGVTLGILALLIALAVGGYFYRGRHPASPAEARQRALQRYPALRLRDSPLNREFVARYHQYQATKRDYFNDPEWPLKLAAESQAAIDQTPSQR